LNEDLPAYHLCTAQTFHSNSPVRLKKSLWESRTTATLVLRLIAELTSLAPLQPKMGHAIEMTQCPFGISNSVQKRDSQ
jgi:hypothetical protein